MKVACNPYVHLIKTLFPQQICAAEPIQTSSVVHFGTAHVVHDVDDKKLARGMRTEVWTHFHVLLVYAAAAYIIWILSGTVAFVSHLGAQSDALAVPVSVLLPASGQPRGEPVDSILELFLRNLHLAFIFVLPHSILAGKRGRWLFSRLHLESHTRLIYNVIAATTLHMFLANFRPLVSPVVLEMPFPPELHLSLSLGCLMFALRAMCFAPGTPELLGVRQALRQEYRPQVPAGMDAITWMGVCSRNSGGDIFFVLFTGLSILPPQLSLGDAVVRVVAAVYLRLRSRAFRAWTAKVEKAHIACWWLRGSLLCLFVLRASSTDWREALWSWKLLAALFVAGGLRFVELKWRPN